VLLMDRGIVDATDLQVSRCTKPIGRGPLRSVLVNAIAAKWWSTRGGTLADHHLNEVEISEHIDEHKNPTVTRCRRNHHDDHRLAWLCAG